MGNFCSDCFKGGSSSAQYETIHSDIIDSPEPVSNAKAAVTPPKGVGDVH
jgi:hypothetical protein